MNKKDLAIIRRRLSADACGRIRGRYVNGKGETVAQFTKDLNAMGREEKERYLAVFRKTLGGVEGQNLLEMDFAPELVMRGEEHALLMRLWEEGLREEEMAGEFFSRAAAALPREEHYLILLMHDSLDMPDARRRDAEEAGAAAFHFLLCSVCPVKLTKPALTYDPGINGFFSREADWAVGAPDTGFLFPAPEDRAANIYRALYYTRDTAEPHADLIRAVFGSEPPMPADEQKEAFQQVMQDALREDCSYEVMQAVHGEVMERMEESRTERQPEAPRITKHDVKDVLAACGVAEERIAAFEAGYDARFGSQGALNAVNVASPRRFEVRTPSVVIRVDSARSDLVETRLIDGHPYILIRADEGVEVNGVNVNIGGKQP